MGKLKKSNICHEICELGGEIFFRYVEVISFYSMCYWGILIWQDTFQLLSWIHNLSESRSGNLMVFI